MRFQYYPETDSLYIDLAGRAGADAREVAPGVVLDVDADGTLVGHRHRPRERIVDLSRLEAVALPAGAAPPVRGPRS